jgi:hypothetical protein
MGSLGRVRAAFIEPDGSRNGRQRPRLFGNKRHDLPFIQEIKPGAAGLDPRKDGMSWACSRKT